MNSIETEKPAFKANETSGTVGKLLLRWLGKEAEITSIEQWSERFVMIEMQGDALREINWSAGQKIQIPIAGMRLNRTYTPITWDAKLGKTRFLVFAHGSAPGCDWAKALAPRSRCQIVGPRRSIEIPGDNSPVVIFGDETVFGLAAALNLSHPTRQIDAFFEVGNETECKPVIERLNLAGASLTQSQPDDLHLAKISKQIALTTSNDSIFVLAGRALAIQRIQREIKRVGVKSSRVYSKAYWAAGKTGLD